MKPAQKLILAFVALLFIVLTLLRVLESDKQERLEPEPEAVSETSDVVVHEKQSNNTNPFGASNAVVNTTLDSEVVNSKPITKTTCDEFNEKYNQDFAKAFDAQLSDEARDRLLLLTGLEGLTPPTDTKTDSEQYRAQQAQVKVNRLALLKNDYQTNKRPTAGVRLIDACLYASAPGACSPSLIENIIAENPENGYLWLFATSYYERFNNPNLELALNNILSTNVFNHHRKEFFFETYDFLSLEGLNPLSAFLLTMSFEATRSYPTEGIWHYCNDNQFPEICLRIGEHFENNSNLLITELAGLVQQSKYWEARGSHDVAAQIEKRRKNYIDNFHRTRSYQLPLSEDTVTIYLESLDIEKEKDWSLFLKEEYERYLNENPNTCVM